MKAFRAAYLTKALSLMGVPYIYGGRSRDGVDCSGVPILALYEATIGGVNLLKGWWTDRLWKELEPVESPRAGDLAFYGGEDPEDVDHAMVVLVPPGPDVGGGIVFGACNGDSRTTTLDIATARRARVMPKPLVQYRSDFRGFRSMSLFIAD